MNFPTRTAFAVILSATLSNFAWANNSVKIADPYADDPASSPWTLSMEPATTFSGRVVRGDATTIAGKDFKVSMHMLLISQTKLRWLADTVALK